MRLIIPVDKTLPKNLLFSSIIQVVLLLGSMACFDGGRSSRVVVYSMITYWIGVALVMVRRRSHPTHGDRVFAKYGFFAILAMVSVAASLWEAVTYR